MTTDEAYCQLNDIINDLDNKSDEESAELIIKLLLVLNHLEDLLNED